jgi:hypothetical protein
MKKIIAIILALVLLAIVATFVVAATTDQIPSAKSTFISADVYGVSAGKAQAVSAWFPVLATQIKTSTPQDLTMNVSAETALVTNVKLSGTAGGTAAGDIMFRVKVDGVVADPGEITFDNRMLQIQGDLTHHYQGTSVAIDDHWIEIFLNTKAAHAFNFALANVGVGVHDIVVEAKIAVNQSDVNGTADAAIGHVSAVVDTAMFKVVK